MEDLDAGKSHICFRMGYQPQAFELAGLTLLDYGTSQKLADMPQTKAGYEGMDADAPWRKLAQDRIEKIRKGDLTVAVKDASGQPVSGAKVSVRMKKQAFSWEPPLWPRSWECPGSENDQYQKEVERLFNRIVFENSLKWGMWEDGASNTGYWRREYVDRGFEMAFRPAYRCAGPQHGLGFLALASGKHQAAPGGTEGPRGGY